jgi:hypothetical protein
MAVGLGASLLNSTSHVFVWNRDPSNPPKGAAGNTGMVLLGYLNADGSGGENLDVGQLTELKHVSYFRF